MDFGRLAKIHPSLPILFWRWRLTEIAYPRPIIEPSTPIILGYLPPQNNDRRKQQRQPPRRIPLVIVAAESVAAAFPGPPAPFPPENLQRFRRRPEAAERDRIARQDGRVPPVGPGPHGRAIRTRDRRTVLRNQEEGGRRRGLGVERRPARKIEDAHRGDRRAQARGG